VKPKLALIIITYNEEKNIERAIKSAQELVDEVIVVDSYSEDRTREIAESLGAKVHLHEWQGYSEQRNYALSLTNAEWVLFLDADEALSPELKEEIKEVMIQKTPDYDGFLIPRKNWYLGGWLKCWSPDRLLRLAKKDKITWDGLVHEKIKLQGPIGKLKKPILHWPFDSLYHQYEKNLRYAELMAKEKYEKRRKFSILDLIIRPKLNFLKHFLLKGCFIEGIRGLIFSLFYFIYTVQKYSILYELWHKRDKKTN